MADQIGIKVNVVPTVNANDLQAAIDTSSKGGQVSLKNLNISSVVLNPSATKTLQTSIQAKIDAGKYSIKSVKLAKIDASAALDALKIDLQKLIGNMGNGGTGGSGNGGGGRKGPAMATDKNINAMTSAIGRFEKQYSNYLNLPQNASLKQNFAFIKQEAEAMSRSIGNIPLSDLRALGSMFDELRKGVTNTASGKTGTLDFSTEMSNVAKQREKISAFLSKNPLAGQVDVGVTDANGNTITRNLQSIISDLRAMESQTEYSKSALSSLLNSFELIKKSAGDSGLLSNSGAGTEGARFAAAQAELAKLQKLYSGLQTEAGAKGLTGNQNYTDMGKALAQAETDLTALESMSGRAFDDALADLNELLLMTRELGSDTSKDFAKMSTNFAPVNDLLSRLNNGALKGNSAADDLRTRLGVMLNSKSYNIEDFAKLKAEAAKLEESLNRNGGAWKTLGSTVLSVAGQFITIHTVWNKIKQAAKAVYTAVKEIDAGMTQLSIVTGATDKQMVRFFNESAAAAKELGASVSAVLSSVETFSRLGYTLSDSLQLSEAATIMSNVAATDINSATAGITSIIKGFSLSPDDASRVADVLVEVGQKYAVSASELMEALQTGGATLQAGNNTLEQSVALIAAGNASIQNASVVGNALKTVSMRIRGAKAELESAGEEVDELASSTSKMRAQVLALSGVDIMLNEDTFKSTYDILLEISQVWDSLTDINRATLLEALAGKRQASTVQSVITNVDDLTGAYEAASNASGVAAEANDKYLNSIDGALGQLQAQQQSLSNSLLDSGIAVGFINALSGLLEVLTKIVETVGAPGFAALAGGGLLAGISTIFKGAAPEKAGMLVKLLHALAGAIGPKAPVILGVAALIAVLGLIATHIEPVRTLEDALADLSEASQEIDKTTEKIESLESQLESLNSRKHELQSLKIDGVATGSELSELKTLEAQTSQLERQLEIENQLLDVQKQGAAQTAIEAIGLTQESKYRYGVQTVGKDRVVNTPEQVTQTEELVMTYQSLVGLEEERKELEDELLNIEENQGKDSQAYKDKYDQLTKLNSAILQTETDALSLEQQMRSLLEAIYADPETYEQNKEIVDNMQGIVDAVAAQSKINNSAVLSSIASRWKGTEGVNYELLGLISIMTDDGIAAFEAFYAEYGEGYDTLTALVEAFEKHIKVLKKDAKETKQASKEVSELNELWESAAFSDAKTDMEKLAKSTGITAKDIEDLALENKTLAKYLDETGVSARFVAECFEHMADGGDLATKMTDEFLSLDRALSEMERHSKGASEAYDEMTASLEKGDFDDNFNNYQATYEKLVEAMESDSSEYGMDFRRQAALFIGYEAAAGPIDEVIEKVKELKKLFGEDDNGLGFMQTLYADQSKIGGDWISMKDGVYSFDIQPEDFDRIAEYYGVTEETIAAMVEAWGMFGDYVPYNISKVTDALSPFGETLGNVTYMSEQALHTLLEGMGYDDLEISMIIRDLKEASSELELLDFSVTDDESLTDLLTKLGDLGALGAEGLKNIDLGWLKAYLSQELGMGIEEIEAFIAQVQGLADESDEINVGNHTTLSEDAPDYHDNARQALDNLAGNDSSYKPEGLFLSSPFYYSGDDGADKLLSDINAVESSLAALEEDGLSLDTTEAQDLLNILIYLNQQKEMLTAPSFMSVDTSGIDDKNLRDAVDLAQQWQQKMWEIETKEGQSVDVSVDKTELYELEREMSELGDEVFIKLGVDTTSHSTIAETIGNATESAINAADADVTAEGKLIWNVDSSEVDKFLENVKLKPGTVVYNARPSNSWNAVIDKLKNQSGVFYYDAILRNPTTPYAQQKSYAAGTAHHFGTAFASGNWGTKTSGMALMGELGPELIVRDGHFFTVGDDSAEIVPYRKNDIIFNAEQTRQILANGRITNGAKRGVAYASGTAFPSGTVTAYNRATGKAYKSSASSTSKSKSKSGNSSDPETFDWIEVLIDRIERAIESLETVAENTYKVFSERNSALKKQIIEVSNEITAQQGAYLAYMQAANNVGLAEKYKKLVQDGSLHIEAISDEKLAGQINEYKEYYEKALDAKQAMEELWVDLSDVYQSLFENIATQFESVIGRIESEIDQLESYISLTETQGYKTAGIYYKALMDAELETIAQLEKQQKELIASLNNAIDYGAVAVGSEAWYEMQAEIDDVSASLIEAKEALADYNNELRQLAWDQFDYLQESIDELISESQFLADTFDENDLFEDSGKMTSSGMSVLALRMQDYQTYLEKAKQYGEEIAKLDKDIATDPYNVNLLERRKELLEAQQDAIAASKQQKEAVVDLVSEGYQKELEALKELIDKYNDTNDAAASLRDYQKDIQEQVKNIAAIEKQLDALGGDTSEENRKVLQELRNSLDEATDKLADSQYDKYISDQKEMLDHLYLEYETLINARLDDVDGLIATCIDTIGGAAADIREVILAQAETIGYSLSEPMAAIWGEGSSLQNALTSIGVVVENIFNFTKSEAEQLVSAINGVTTALGTGQSKSTVDTITNIGNVTSGSGSSGGSGGSGGSGSSGGSSGGSSYKGSGSSSSSKSSNPSTNRKVSELSSNPISTQEMKSLQRALNSLGFGAGSADGIFGKKTKTALENFQKSGAYNTSVPTAELGKTPLGAATRRKFRFAGYKSGARSILEDQLAWINEAGAETIIRPSENALLTALKSGDAVLNARASENIWDMANSPMDFIRKHLGLPATTGGSTIQNDVAVTFSLPGVKNYPDFLNAMRNDPKFVSFVRSITVDQLAGKSAMRKYNNKW